MLLFQCHDQRFEEGQQFINNLWGHAVFLSASSFFHHLSSLFSATASCSLPVSLVFGELLVRGYPVRMIFWRMPMFCWQPSSHDTDTPSFLSTCTSLSLSLSFSLWVIDRSQCSWLWQLASWQTPHARTFCVCVCVCECGSFNVKF